MAHKNLILIYGDEEYLSDMKKREILSELGGAGGFNYHAFDADTFDMAMFRELTLTPPLMEQNRRILLSHTLLLSHTGAAELAAILSEVPETTFIIFNETQVDARGKLYKLIQKNGEIYKFDSVEAARGNARYGAEARVRAFAAETLGREGLRIDSCLLDELLGITGFDMRNLSTELEKLICYKLGSPEGAWVTGEDIDLIISGTLKDRIFYMADEKLLGHTTTALAALEELFALKTSPMRILYLLARQYDQAYLVKDCLLRRMSDKEIEQATRLKGWQIKRIKAQVRSRSPEELRDKLEDILRAEENIKTGRMDGRLAAELLIIA